MSVNEAFASFDELEAFMKDVFVKVGVPPQDAAVCAEILIESDKRGIDSHGVGRFKPIYIDRIKDGIQNPVTNFEIVKDHLATAVVDGHDGMGHVIGKRSMRMAIDFFIACGAYAQIAKENMIGMTGTNARPSIAPTFGIDNMLGTNPLTFGIPTDEDFPFVLDCATSVSQRGKIEHYERIDKTMPEGWVINRDGTSETNPLRALEGLNKDTCALAPLGGLGEETAGYKGYGYAVVVEILSAALQQGQFLKALNGFDADGKKVPYHLGHFFMAIDINAFVEPDKFKKTTGDILRQLRASAKAPGKERIYTAGEKEYLAWLQRKDTGVPLNESLKKTLTTLREEYNLDNYPFDF